MKTIKIFAIIFLLALILPLFFKSLRFDFVNNGGRGFASSESREESLKRNVYIGGLELVSVEMKNDSMRYDQTDAWIEKMWSQGSWYWTTRMDPNDRYQIVLHTKLLKKDLENVYFVNKTNNGAFEEFGCAVGNCSGKIFNLPNTDTIRLDMIRKKARNVPIVVLGELVLVLDRRKSPQNNP